MFVMNLVGVWKCLLLGGGLESSHECVLKYGFLLFMPLHLRCCDPQNMPPLHNNY